MNSYVFRLAQNKRTCLFVGLIFLIPMIDIVSLFIQFNHYGGVVPEFSTFLSSSSIGHSEQIILTWFLPLIVLLLCCDQFISEYKKGYHILGITKYGRFKYYQKRLMQNMLITMVIMLGSLLLNMAMGYVLFQDGVHDLSLTIETVPNNIRFAWMVENHVLANLLCIGLMSAMTALCAGTSTVICFVFPEFKYAYILSFFTWFIFMTGHNTIPAAVQPFTEITLTQMIEGIFYPTLVFSGIILVGMIYQVKYNEI